MWSMNALNSAYIEIPQCGETSTANFDPTPVTYVNKGAFGLVTVNVRNVSDVDQLVFSGQYNSSALYVQAITLNRFA
jgi:hypothetical protein